MKYSDSPVIWFTQNPFNPFVLNAPFLNPLKRVEGVDRGAERKGALVELMG